MGQLQITILHIQDILLILSHAEQLFNRFRGKGNRQMEIPAYDGLEETVSFIQCAAFSRLFQEKFSILVVKRDITFFGPSANLQHRRNFAVCYDSLVFLHLDFGFHRFLGKEGIIRILQFSQHSGAHTEAVGSPGFYRKHFPVPAVNQCISFLTHRIHKQILLYKKMANRLVRFRLL